MNILKKRLFRVTIVITTAALAILLGFVLMFVTEPLTFTMILAVLSKVIGALLFIGGFVVLKEYLQDKL